MPSGRWTQHGTWPSQTHSRSLLPHGKDCIDLGMCLQVSQNAGRHPAMTQEFRPWEQARTSGI